MSNTWHCAYTILNVHWSNFIVNIEILKLTKTTGIEAILQKSHLWWEGQGKGIEDYHLLKTLLFREWVSDHCISGTIQKWYKDSLERKAHLLYNQQPAVSNRSSWQSLTGNLPWRIMKKITKQDQKKTSSSRGSITWEFPLTTRPPSEIVEQRPISSGLSSNLRI